MVILGYRINNNNGSIIGCSKMIIFKCLLLFTCCVFHVVAYEDFGFEGLHLRQEIEDEFDIEILSATNSSFDVLIAVRSQRGEYHETRIERFESNLRKQINDENKLIFAIVRIHKVEKVVRGSWTLFPLFQSKYNFLETAKWVIICEDSTEFNLSKISKFLSTKNSTTPEYFGHCLQDKQPVIIHHFGPYTTDINSFNYPLFATGVIFSQTTIRYLSELDIDDIVPSILPYTSIDVQHELAWLIKETSLVELSCEKMFCVELGENCFSWVNTDMNNGCENSHLNLEDIHIAVKTYAGNYKSRLPLVMNTWLNDAKNITKFYTHSLEETNQFNGELIFIDVGFNNTGGGHCKKLEFIMKHFSRNENAKWLVVADDDTFINTQMLVRILSCVDPENEGVILGERYGFLEIEGTGYPYITGGGGIVMNRRAVEMFVESIPYCGEKTPDDMWLGMFAVSYGVLVLDFPNFHQSTVDSYHEDYIKCFKAVSYHRIKSVNEYEDNLKV